MQQRRITNSNTPNTPFIFGLSDPFSDLVNWGFTGTKENYPPHNISKEGDNYKIEMAVAGFKSHDISVMKEKNVLVVSGSTPKGNVDQMEKKYLHRGLAQRDFKLFFNIAPNIVVKDVFLEDGILNIEMVQVIPEEEKPVNFIVTVRK